MNASKNLKNLGIKTCAKPSRTIRDLINNINNYAHIESRVGVCEIPCLDHNGKYEGDASWTLENEFMNT